MVYLECPECKEITEHQIIGLRKDNVITRCTECVNEWKGIITYWILEKRNGAIRTKRERVLLNKIEERDKRIRELEERSKKQ